MKTNLSEMSVNEENINLYNLSIEKLKLVAHIKEIELKALQISLERDKLNSHLKCNCDDNYSSYSANSTVIMPVEVDEPINFRPKIKLKLTPKKIVLNWFGKENCQFYYQYVEDWLKISRDSREYKELICQTIIEKMHFNNQFPENKNLYFNKSDISGESILVYLDCEWSSIYYLTLICEYIRGTLYRISLICSEIIYKTVQSVIENNLEEVQGLIFEAIKRLSI